MNFIDLQVSACAALVQMVPNLYSAHERWMGVTELSTTAQLSNENLIVVFPTSKEYRSVFVGPRITYLGEVVEPITSTTNRILEKRMLEALWSFEFKSSSGLNGSGVAVFETGRVLGGDSMMTYIGFYKVRNGLIEANIKVEKYVETPGMVSVTGFNSFNLFVTGTPDHNHLTLSGHVVEDTSRKITITAIRRAELP